MMRPIGTYCLASEIENSPLCTRRDAFGEFRDRILAIGADQFGERREQAGLRQAVAIDAVMARFRPGLVEIAERGLLLLVVGQGIAGEGEGERIS